MKEYKRTPHQQKIIDGMTQVYDKLIEFKKKANSELYIFISKERQIVYELKVIKKAKQKVKIVLFY